MMGDMLSQAEIDALLGGSDSSNETETQFDEPSLTDIEKDALGEIGNISMGTAATTLSTLLGQKVLITTPVVEEIAVEELKNRYVSPYVLVKVNYTIGIKGSNLLVINERDVKVITSLMMGGDGIAIDEELTELHLSAISEAMNQMVGSASTSLSNMFNKKIDISPPKTEYVSFNDTDTLDKMVEEQSKLIRISFRMVIGDLIDSEIMQLLPIEFAQSMSNQLLNPPSNEVQSQESSNSVEAPITEASTASYSAAVAQSQPVQQNTSEQPMNSQPTMVQQPIQHQQTMIQPQVSVQPVQFQEFSKPTITNEMMPNMNLIMDVPLQVTVELGRTNKIIKEILDFSPGTIIELDKLAGEPIDILVNGKFIAKGEVVVIDENFGIRVTDIVSPEKRI